MNAPILKDTITNVALLAAALAIVFRPAVVAGVEALYEAARDRPAMVAAWPHRAVESRHGPVDSQAGRKSP